MDPLDLLREKSVSYVIPFLNIIRADHVLRGLGNIMPRWESYVPWFGLLVSIDRLFDFAPQVSPKFLGHTFTSEED